MSPKIPQPDTEAIERELKRLEVETSRLRLEKFLIGTRNDKRNKAYFRSRQAYKAEFENGLTEHEFDHVFFGKFNGEPKVNELEVSAWRWASVGDLKLAMKNSPQNFTVWFKILFEKIY